MFLNKILWQITDCKPCGSRFWYSASPDSCWEVHPCVPTPWTTSFTATTKEGELCFITHCIICVLVFYACIHILERCLWNSCIRFLFSNRL